MRFDQRVPAPLITGRLAAPPTTATRPTNRRQATPGLPLGAAVDRSPGATSSHADQDRGSEISRRQDHR